MDKPTILVVDDEAAQRDTLSGYLKKKAYTVLTAAGGEEALSAMREQVVDMVLTDMRMPGMSGLELLAGVKEINPEILVIMITAFGRVEDAVTAMKAGASDYIQKPLDLDYLDIVLEKNIDRKHMLAENRELKAALRSTFDFKQVITANEKMEKVLNLAGRAAASRASLLIRGESGTGKEIIARAIHLSSPRQSGPFVAVNVAAVPENLIESEFFGHEKGAFTGADRQRRGRFEQADKGTLFIDEIGDIPVSSQVKLLRVLQERSFERVGGSDLIDVDVRIIAATNQSLESMIADGRFREDLFYRLNVISICIPPLRKRKGDIPLLADHFLRSFSDQEGKKVTSLSREAMQIIMNHDFPGNVRELENIIQRGVVLARTDMVTMEDLPPNLRTLKSERTATAEEGNTLPERVRSLEIRMIQDALEASAGNQSRAAGLLGISERNLRYKMDKYQLKS
ncbi:sigma-54-dependent Fis family transcriptional regulator [bacterium]|nr:sigma-54-dependent Fis family transcriptional regulator [bacterium]